jgi:hypothetical protein
MNWATNSSLDDFSHDPIFRVLSSTVRNPPPQLVHQTPQKQTHPKKNRPAGWREGLKVALCAVPTDLRASLPRELRRRSETHPHTWFAKRHKNKPAQKIYVCVLCLHYRCCCHKNKPTQKKQSGRMTGWIKGCSVCCVCATAAVATKTNPPKKKTVRPDDGTNLGLL